MARPCALQALRRKAALRNEVAVSVTPGFAAAAPWAGEAFGDQCLAHVVAVDDHEGDGAAVAIDAAGGVQLEAPCLCDERARGVGGAIAERSFRRAARARAGLGRVDIDEATVTSSRMSSIVSPSITRMRAIAEAALMRTLLEISALASSVVCASARGAGLAARNVIPKPIAKTIAKVVRSERFGFRHGQEPGAS
jgi:hypothetical protein